MNKKSTFNASFRLDDDHLDGVDRGVVDLDVVLLVREVSRDDLLASDGFEFLARSHVRLGNRALNDVRHRRRYDGELCRHHARIDLANPPYYA